MNSYKYLCLLILPALVITGSLMGGWWNLLTPVSCFVVHPVVSFMAGKRSPIHEKEWEQPPHNWQFRLVALLFVPVLSGLFIWSIYRVREINSPDWLLLAIAVGCINGIIGFVLAHEFIHRVTIAEKTAGYLLLLINGYLHYKIEHIGGHHVYACTKIDPHTARKGESLYRFLPRAISGTYFNAWKIEIKRLVKHKELCWGLKNKMLWYTIVQCCFCILPVLFAGLHGLFFYFVQCAVSILLLHTVNYLQHYGLHRQENEKNIPGRMNEHHAWRSGQPLQDFNLFRLENHADHHMHPTHPYHKLVEHQLSPQLPGGYTTMICLAMFPPLWFKIIDNKIPLNLNTQQHDTNY